MNIIYFCISNMSVLFIKNILNKRYKFCYQFTKNCSLLVRNRPITEKCQLLQNQLTAINYCVLRGKSQSLTIKQYQSSRKYTTTWIIERFLGWSFIPLIPMAFLVESKGLEMLLCINTLLHTYCGCQSMCSDYLRSHVVGKFLPFFVRISIVTLSMTSLVGAYLLIYKDIGLTNMIKKIWSIRGRNYIPPKNLQKVEQ